MIIPRSPVRPSVQWWLAVSRGVPWCPTVSCGVPLCEIDIEIDIEIDTEIDVVPRGAPWCLKQ
eukprot:1431659-Pyramimonas_sp.AAC.1